MAFLDPNTVKGNNTLVAVSLQNVFLSYGFRKKIKILKNVNLCVLQGTIFGLLGPSGCGKTTVLKCIINSLKPQKGIVNVFDEIPGSSESKIPGSGVGYMPQEIALYSELTINETLSYFGRLHLMKKNDIKERIEFLLQFLTLKHSDKRIQTLSGGEKRRVSLAIALLHHPPLLILDEPTVGVDPMLRKSIWNYLVNISSLEGVTVIITTHYIEEARKANKIALMRDGTMLAQDEPDVLINNLKVSNLEEAFLKLCEDEDNTTNSGTQVEISNEAFTPPTETIVHQEKSNKKKSKCQLHYGFFSFWRIYALTILNFTRMGKNRVLIITQFLNPVIQVFLFYWTIGSDPKDLQVAVFNQDNNLGLEYLHSIDNETIHLVNVDSLKDGEDLVRNGKAWAVIDIWPNFTNALTENSQSKLSYDSSEAGVVHVTSDNTNLLLFYTMEEAFIKAYLKFANSTNLYHDKFYQPQSIPVMFKEPIYGPVKASYKEYITPGLLASVIFFLSISLSAVSLVIDKDEGLVDRSFVSGAMPIEMLSAHIITHGTIIVFQVLIVIASILSFGIENRGSYVWLIILAFSQGLCGMTFGFAISAIANDPTAAIAISIALYMPFFLTSGSIFSIESMPTFFQKVAQFQPLTLPIMAFRWILSRGKGITFPPVWKGFMVNIGWSVFCLILATFLIRVRK